MLPPIKEGYIYEVMSILVDLIMTKIPMISFSWPSMIVALDEVQNTRQLTP